MKERQQDERLRQLWDRREEGEKAVLFRGKTVPRSTLDHSQKGSCGKHKLPVVLNDSRYANTVNIGRGKKKEEKKLKYIGSCMALHCGSD